MNDHNELIEQYRTTLEVMKEKLNTLKEEKEKQNQEILEKKSKSPEFKELEGNLERYQEKIQSLNLEIFKEKGNLRKLKADNEWDENKLENSEEILALRSELEECIKENKTYISNQNNSNTESKLARLGETNPKLFNLVKKIIFVEDINTNLKAELSFLEQERNKTRSEYYKITQSIAHEEKNKLKIRETEKEIEWSEYNCRYLKEKLLEVEIEFKREKNIVDRHEVKELLEKQEELKEIKGEFEGKINKMNERIKKLDTEIDLQKKSKKKVPLTNLKQEIKNLETEITEKTKEIRFKLIERKKLHLQREQKFKELVAHRGENKIKYSRDKELKSPNKVHLSKSLSHLSTPESSRRDILVNLVGRSIAKRNSSSMKYALKHFGSQDQGLTTKLVQLNRDEFLRKINIPKIK